MIRIVIIEDESLVAADIQSRLRRAGYDIVGIASRGEDGIAKVDELLPDVVLVDIALKGEMDGIDAAQQIIERFDIPVIYVTVHTDAATVRRATATASYGFIVKPFNELELLAAIEMAVYKHGMEVKTRESDRRIRELTESLSEVIFEADMAGNITFINHAGLKEFGYTKEQVEGGVTLYDLIPPDKHEEIREAIAQPVIDEPSEWIEVPGVRRDGSTFPVAVRASLIVRGGVPVGIRGIALNVTEQKRAEQKLEESERHLYELTDSLPDIVLETDVGGTFTFLNRTGMDALGYTEDDLKKQVGFEDVIVPADRARVRENFKKRLERTPWEWVEYTALRKDGSTFPTSIRSTALMRDGVVVGVRSVAIDITELKRAEEELRANETRFKTFFQESPIGIELYDANGLLVDVNDAGLDAFGIANVEQVIGFNLFEDPNIPDYEMALLKKGQTVRFEIDFDFELVKERNRYRTTKSGQRVLDVMITPLGGENDVLGGYLVQVQDITEQSGAEGKVQDSERHIRELTDALPVVVFETDATGQITFVNAMSVDLFGYTKEEFEAGMSWFQLIAPAERERARAVFRQRGGGDDIGRVEYPGLRKDGSTFPLSVRAALIRRDGAVVGVRGIVVDITERKQAEERAKEHTHTIEIVNQITTAGNRATDVRSFAETVTALTLELMHLDVGALYLVDDDDRSAKLQYARSVRDTAVDAVKTIPLDDTLCAESCVKEGRRAIIEDQEPSYVPCAAAIGLVSHARVPLYHHDKCIGELHVGSFARRVLFEAEKELLIAIGNEVGTVIAKLQTEESLKRHAEMVDLAKDGIIIRDLDDRIVYWNKGAERLYGWSAAEAEGQTIYTLLHTKHSPQRWKKIESTLVAGGGWVGEFTHTAKDGKRITIDSRQTLYKDAAGEPAAIFEINTDVTRRKRAEEALAWESAVNSTIARLFTPLIGPTSTIEDIARAILDEAKQLTGSEVGFISVIDPVNRDSVTYGVTQMMPEGGAIPEEKRQIRFPIGADGSYPALLGHALNTKKGFYTNAPATHPAGLDIPDEHAPLVQFLAAPALVGDNVEGVVGQIALANPGRNYTKRDLRAVERLADVYALAVVRTREEDAIESAIKERETLLKEIHHRVKNNMQIISSLLSLQAAQATERETVDMLNESQRRIRSMALIHEKLYRSGSLAEIDFGDYVESFVDELLRMYNVPLGAITITADSENIQFDVDTAIPCALIVNELVSNSLKYAFPNGRTGTVTVALQRANGTHTLTVADNGVGLPADLDFRTTDSLGMQLVVTLVNQLEGTIELNRDNGTAFVISFHVD